MEDNKDFTLPHQGLWEEDPPLDTEFSGGMPQLDVEPAPQEDEVLLADEIQPEEPPLATIPTPEFNLEGENLTQEELFTPVIPEDPATPDFSFAQDLYEDPLPQLEEDVPYYPPVDQDPEFPEVAFLADPEESDEFQEAFSGEAKEDGYVPSGKVRPTRKGRPKHKKGYGLFGIPHILATAVWLAIILVIGTTLGRFLWVCAADVLAFGRESKKVSITITANDTIEDIAQKLYDGGLIRYPYLFEFYAGLAVDEGDIIPGTFEMDTLYDYHALVIQMGPRSSNRTVITDVLIPEGYNCRQIFALLEEKGICTVEELEEYAANGEFADFWFLEGVARGDKYCLEGFLFPDTYDFYANSTPREALGKMLLGFEDRFTQEIYDQLPALNERLSNMMRKNGCSDAHIAENQLDLRGLLTVASLIEEETAGVQESPTIASVIYNRLTEDLVYERYLGIDAALIYATGSSSNIDTSLDSPYNTYINPGLTPGPISNPGLDSINAALNFADSNYYYYVLNPETRQHDFSVTLEEHEKKVEKYKEMAAQEEE